MGAHKLQVDYISLKAAIDASKNMIYVVKDGRVIAIDPPKSGHGEQTAVWIGGKVDRVIDRHSLKI